MKYITLALGFLAATLLLSPPAHAVDADVEAALIDGNWEQVYQLLGDDDLTDDPAAVVLKGLAAQATNRNREAFELFARVTSADDQQVYAEWSVAMAKKHHGNPYAMYVLSVSLHRSGLLQDALKGFTAAIKADSTFSLAFNGRGLVELDLADTAAAQKDFMIATNRDTTLANAFYNLSHIFFNREFGPPALNALNYAITNDSTFSRSYYLRGMLHAQYTRYPGAIADLRRAIELNPNFPEDHYFLALAYLRSDEFDEAEHWFRSFLEMSPAGMEEKVKRARDHLKFIAEQK